MDQTKPTFGVSTEDITNNSNVAQSSENVVAQSSENVVAQDSTKKAQKQKRQEIGAIWERTSRKNTPYLSIKLNLPKSTLEELLKTCTSEEVNMTFLGFPNERKESGDSKPKFCLYEKLD